jgi:U3 small nucleolar RNA-associated protein 4
MLARILSIAWHRDEDMIVTGGIDNIRVWDVNSGQVLQRISLGRIDKNKETLVWCLAITSLVLVVFLANLNKKINLNIF